MLWNISKGNPQPQSSQHPDCNLRRGWEPEPPGWVTPDSQQLLRIITCSVMSKSLQPHGLYSLPVSSVHGVLQARILEWVAPPSPGRWFSWGRDRTHVSCVAGRFFTVWTTKKAPHYLKVTTVSSLPLFPDSKNLPIFVQLGVCVVPQMEW